MTTSRSAMLVIPMSIHSLVPDAKAVLALEPEELAGVVMEHFNSLPASERNNLNRYNFGLAHTVQEYPGNTTTL